MLGIDNIIFISIVVDRLPPERREFTRRLGLGLAMFMRIGLLLTLAWLVGLTAPFFSVLGEEISGRDIILIAGGLFLLWKATGEIHGLEGADGGHEQKVASTFFGILAQIAVIDLVFSLDSIITAVGMVDEIPVMVAAVIASVLLMMAAAGQIGRFVSRYPTVKMLALSFLIMVGMALVADGLDFHVPKGYIYFAMAFSVAVEMLNLRMRAKMLIAGSPSLLRCPDPLRRSESKRRGTGKRRAKRRNRSTAGALECRPSAASLAYSWSARMAAIGRLSNHPSELSDLRLLGDLQGVVQLNA